MQRVAFCKALSLPRLSPANLLPTAFLGASTIRLGMDGGGPDQRTAVRPMRVAVGRIVRSPCRAGPT